MATKRKKKDTEHEELRRRALEPFRPSITDEDIRRHEEEVRKRSLDAIHRMKEDITESEMANIKMRADFEHRWNE